MIIVQILQSQILKIDADQSEAEFFSNTHYLSVYNCQF